MPAEFVNIAEDGRSLNIGWRSGEHNVFGVHQLWRNCPSAHAKRRRMDDPHLEPNDDLRIVSVTPIGLYAINIGFSDGHARGIYPWPFLKQLTKKTAASDYIIA